VNTQISFIISCGADAGMGHLYRSLTLARQLKEKGFESHFYVTDGSCASFVSDFPCSKISDEWPSDTFCAIIDGIKFPSDFIEFVKRKYERLIFIDDLGGRPISADLLVNPNLFAHTLDYSFQHGKSALGLDYAIINPQFSENSSLARNEPRALITYGGGITAKLSLQVAEQLSSMFDGPIDVALGNFLLKQDIPYAKNVYLHRNANMVSLMSKATVYIGGLGTSYIEAMASGLYCVTSAIVDNQEPVLPLAKALGSKTVMPFCARLVASEAKMALNQEFSVNLSVKIDGKGTARVADLITEVLNKPYK